MPTHTERQLVPSSSATPVPNAPSTAPRLKRPWNRTSLPGHSESAAANDVHDHVDEASGGRRERERDRRTFRAPVPRATARSIALQIASARASATSGPNGR